MLPSPFLFFVGFDADMSAVDFWAAFNEAKKANALGEAEGHVLAGDNCSASELNAIA